MEVASRPAIPEPPIAVIGQLSENSRLGFGPAESTLFQGAMQVKYLNGVRDTTSVASNPWQMSLKAQQQNTTQKQTTSFVNSDRVKLAATGIGNVIVGVGKAVAAAGALAAAPETGGLTVPLAGYAAIGAGGNLAAGGAQIVGAITGHVAEASKGADAAAAVTTFSGAITLARTGSVEKASTAAAVEGVFSFGFTGGATGNLLGASRLEKVSTVIDASQNVQQLIMTPVASH
jgi:hypothetical protein